MVLTIAIEGLGVIANADGTSDSAGGTWGFTGSGGVSNGNTTDTFYYGTSSMSMALSGNGKNGWLYYNYGSALNFSTTYAGQFIYVWIHCPTIGLSATLANAGVAIRAGTDTSNYRTWVVAGSNGSNGWDGGWQCFVIDPTKAGSITDTGTYSASTVQYIGLRGQTTATAKGDNFFISQMAVGSGLRITGTSTNGWQETVDYCTDLTNRAWGMMQEREGIYYAYGNMNIGDPAMSANCSFVDSGRTIQFGNSEYWSGTGTTFNTSLPTTASGITIEDDNVATTYTTTFTDGVIVGSDNGRSGSTIIGNTNENVFFDASGLANAASDVNLYGTTFRSFGGTMTFEADADHALLGVNFIDCSQVVPSGAVVIRNCVFAETQDTDAAILWNASIDIQDCSFIANTVGAAYEYPTQGSYSQTNLTYSGNTNDILYSAAASSGVLTINATDSNPSTSEITNPTGNSVSIVNSVNINISIKDGAGNAIENAAVAVYKTSDSSQLMNELSAVTTGLATETYNYLADTPVSIKVRKSSTGTRYYPVNTSGTITSTGLTLTVVMTEDNIAA